MTHAEMNELYDLYALGVLEPELAIEIAGHLEEQCSYCIEHVRDALTLITALPGVVESVQPPTRLRERVLASVRPPKRSISWMFALAGLSAAAVGLLVFSLWSLAQANRSGEQLKQASEERDRLQTVAGELSRSQAETERLRGQLVALTTERERLRSAVENLGRPQSEVTKLRAQLAALTGERDQLRIVIEKSRQESEKFRGQLAALTNERDQLQAAVATAQDQAARLREESASLRTDQNQLRTAVEILSTPRTRTINFGRLESIPHGHVFVNPEGLLLVGSQSPPIPDDRTLELWLMPVQGAPQPAGLFRPNASGQFIYTTAAINSSQFKAIAVSVEPRQGSSAPTTKPILVVPLG